MYSSLPNRRVVRNKRGGGKDDPFLNQRGTWNKHGGENFQASHSNKKKNKMNQSFKLKKQENQTSGARD